MGSKDEFRRIEADYHDVVQEMLDGLDLPAAEFDPLSKRGLRTMALYQNALSERVGNEPQEISEHYAKMAADVPMQFLFFASALSKYRKRRDFG